MNHINFVVKAHRGGTCAPEYVERIDLTPIQMTTNRKLALLMGRFTAEDAVKSIQTNPHNGRVTFKCIVCEQTVTTLNFNCTSGNRRTQAAAAINRHAAVLHLPRPASLHLAGRRAL
jgi:hypothetical protein